MGSKEGGYEKTCLGELVGSGIASGVWRGFFEQTNGRKGAFSHCYKAQYSDEYA